MLPILLKIGPVPIHSYGLMIAIGFLVALYLIQREFKKHGADPDIPTNMAFWCLLLGILGTRILHIIMYPKGYSWNDPIGWIAIWRGGLVFQGALIGPLIYCWFGVKHYKIDFWWGADRAVPYIPLAHAFGRIGCVMNGCCYGQRTDVPWAIRFPRLPWDFSIEPTGSPAYVDHCQRFSGISPSLDHWSFPIHPTQFYEIAGLLIILAALLFIRRRGWFVQGSMLPLYLIFYGIVRFIVEFYRGDHNPVVFGSISVQQLFCLVFVAVGGVVLALLTRHTKAAAAALSHAK